MKTYLTIFCLLYAVDAYLFANKTKLRKDLLTNYEKVFQPNEYQFEPTNISINFYIRSLHELLEGKGEIGVVGSLVVGWTDVRLVWNPSDYGGDLNKISVFVNDIWTPYLVLMNPYRKINMILQGELACKVWYNGYVSCIPPPNFFEALCDVDVRFYPFDSQNCTLRLYVPGYSSSDLKFQHDSPTINMEMYEEDDVWDLKSNRIFVHTQQIDKRSVETFKVEIFMERKWHYYMINLSPIFLLDFLQILVFYLPNESGERITFSITVLLTEIVFLTMIQEKLPEASEPDISYLIYKQLADTCVSFCIMLAVLQAGIFYNQAEREQTKKSEEWLRRLSKALCWRKKLEKYPRTTWKILGEVFDYFCLSFFTVVYIAINLLFYESMQYKDSL